MKTKYKKLIKKNEMKGRVWWRNNVYFISKSRRIQILFSYLFVFKNFKNKRKKEEKIAVERFAFLAWKVFAFPSYWKHSPRGVFVFFYQKILPNIRFKIHCSLKENNQQQNKYFLFLSLLPHHLNCKYANLIWKEMKSVAHRHVCRWIVVCAKRPYRLFYFFCCRLSLSVTCVGSQSNKRVQKHTQRKERRRENFVWSKYNAKCSVDSDDSSSCMRSCDVV